MGASDPKARSEPHSGRLLLRMPKTLHAELARRAEAEGVSLNQLIVGALSRAVGAPEPTVAGRPAGAVEPPAPRGLRAALIANLIVVGLAGVAAIVLLLVAWHRGF